MPIASAIRASIQESSWIRKMFEEGAALRQRLGPDRVFDLSLGNPDLEPPLEFYKTLEQLVGRHRPGDHGYMSNAGYLATRQAMANKVTREHGIELSAEHVVMTVGAAGGLNVVLKTILNPGDEVIAVRPHFVEYSAYAKNHGGVLRAVAPQPDFSLDLPAIERALGVKTAAVLLNSPNNPTGRIYPADTIIELGQRLLAHAERTGRRVYLLVDEPYRDLVYDGRLTPPVMCHYPDTIVVNSFSKSLSLAGERIGYIAASPLCERVDELLAGLVICNRVLGFVNAPALMQRVLAELGSVLVDISPYARRRDRLCAALSQAGIEFARPDGAFYLFCRAPEPDDVAFVHFLKEYGLLAVPGTGFAYPGWFRLAYAVPDRVVDGAAACLQVAMRDWHERSSASQQPR